MKIDLSAIDREQFMVHPHVIAGETCWLVQPQHIGARWEEGNMHLRSSVWNSEGELVSASFPKFTNWAERPELHPAPTDLNDARFIEKLDGSTLIVSKYKGQLIVRTRGTVDATKLDNGHEIAGLMVRYPRAFDLLHDTAAWSLIFEWTSPLNRIVIDYGTEPDIALIGAIHHEDYRLWTQDELDILAALLKVKRPRHYSFGSIDEMLKTVEALDGQEGLCVYYNGDQHIRKVKSARYLMLHRLKSELGSLSKVLDLYMAHLDTEAAHPPVGMQPESLYAYIARTFDFEIAEQVAPFIEQIEHAHAIVGANIEEVDNEMCKLTEAKLSRKDCALSILSRYKESGLSGLAFIRLDKRAVPAKTLRDLIERQLAPSP